MTIAIFEQISWAGSIARSRAQTESRLARVSEAEEMKTRLAAVHRRVRGTVSPGIKVNALARFDEDVLSHPRTDTVILMMGINDIGWPDSVLEPRVPAPSAEEIIDGYEQLIARAHAHGMRIIGATLTPFKGAPLEGYYKRRQGREARGRQ